MLNPWGSAWAEAEGAREPGASLPSLQSVAFLVGLATCTLVVSLGLGSWDLGMHQGSQGTQKQQLVAKITGFDQL